MVEEPQPRRPKRAREEQHREPPRTGAHHRQERRNHVEERRRYQRRDHHHHSDRRRSRSRSYSSSRSRSRSSRSKRNPDSSDDEGGILDRQEDTRRLIPRAWPSSRRELEHVIKEARQVVSEKNPPVWQRAKNAQDSGWPLAQHKSGPPTASRQTTPGGRMCVRPLHECAFLRAVAGEGAEQRFHEELAKLQDTTSTSGITRAIAKAKRSQAKAELAGGAGALLPLNKNQTNLSQHRRNTNDCTAGWQKQRVQHQRTRPHQSNFRKFDYRT
jgi:hypothetical protein